MFKLVLKICMAVLLPSIPVSAETVQQNYTALFTVSAVSAVLFLTLLISSAARIRSIKRESRQRIMTDPETGIGNRADFIRRFENNISDFTRRKYYIAYFTVDSNYLQAYHKDAAFSDVVKYMANVLSENVRNYEFAARVTESGFAMAFRSEGKEPAAERVKAIMDKLSKYVDPTGQIPQGTFNAAIYSLENDDSKCEMLLFNLRRHCTQILGAEKQLVFCDSHSMNSVQLEKELVESIKLGLSRQEFKLYVQFIVDNATKSIVSAEALSRWENPETGTQLPGKYLGAMMNAGLIVDFDYYMFEQVCRQLELWRSTSLKELSISCNFTRITISEAAFVEKIKEISEKYSFDRSKLIMEITEEAMEKNRERAMRNMLECKKLGFGIALDDLGSGFTSPINLCEYPLDVVKIDREVLLKTEETRGKELFNGLIALAHSLNLKVVCEGVETEQQDEYVSSTQCDYIQGWFFSKAIPAKVGEEFVNDFSQKYAPKKVIFD